MKEIKYEFVEDTVASLTEAITYYATKYYTGQAEISDYLFDNLVNRLAALAPDSEILRTPGWGYVPNLDKARHEFGNVGSLSKYRNYMLLNTAIGTITRRIIMPKFDGISCVAYYKNGHIDKAVTRGNGVEGTNVTDKYIYITRVSDMANFNSAEVMAIRGELVISDENFNKLKEKYPQYKNSRNAVAGIINSKEMSDCLEYVDFVPYKLQGIVGTRTWIGLTEFLETIRYYFPHTTDYKIAGVGSLIEQELLEEAYNLRNGYPCDGVVVSTDEFGVFDDGTVDIIQYAYKFEDEKATTRVDHIEWNLTRTGKMAPVACIDPVELDGATIKRVTCFNAQYVRENRVGEDAWIEIQRSGLVIPDIQKVVEESPKFSLPTVCPACGHELVWIGTDLVCNNPECASAKSAQVYQWVSKVGEVKGVSWNTINDLIDMMGFDSIQSIYEDYTHESAINKIKACNYGSATEAKLIEVMDKLYGEIDPALYFLGMNIKGLGWKMAKTLADAQIHIDIRNYSATSSSEYNEFTNKLYSLPNCGYSMVEAIIRNLESLVEVANLIKFAEKIDEEPASGSSVEAQYFAVTGSLNYGSRNEFCEYVKQFGWELADVKNSKYLVTNNPDPNSSKGRKAKSLGVEIITEEEFLNLIKK